MSVVACSGAPPTLACSAPVCLMARWPSATCWTAQNQVRALARVLVGLLVGCGAAAAACLLGSNVLRQLSWDALVGAHSGPRAGGPGAVTGSSSSCCLAALGLGPTSASQAISSSRGISQAHVNACCCCACPSGAAGDARPLKKPPNWLKRPVSVSFGFGGRLASLTNHKQQMQDPMTGQVRHAMRQ